eukprot:gene11187-7764_t
MGRIHTHNSNKKKMNNKWKGTDEYGESIPFHHWCCESTRRGLDDDETRSNATSEEHVKARREREGEWRTALDSKITQLFVFFVFFFSFAQRCSPFFTTSTPLQTKLRSLSSTLFKEEDDGRQGELAWWYSYFNKLLYVGFLLAHRVAAQITFCPVSSELLYHSFIIIIINFCFVSRHTTDFSLRADRLNRAAPFISSNQPQPSMDLSPTGGGRGSKRSDGEAHHHHHLPSQTFIERLLSDTRAQQAAAAASSTSSRATSSQAVAASSTSSVHQSPNNINNMDALREIVQRSEAAEASQRIPLDGTAEPMLAIQHNLRGEAVLLASAADLAGEGLPQTFQTPPRGSHLDSPVPQPLSAGAGQSRRQQHQEKEKDETTTPHSRSPAVTRSPMEAQQLRIRRAAQRQQQRAAAEAAAGLGSTPPPAAGRDKSQERPRGGSAGSRAARSPHGHQAGWGSGTRGSSGASTPVGTASRLQHRHRDDGGNGSDDDDNDDDEDDDEDEEEEDGQPPAVITGVGRSPPQRQQDRRDWYPYEDHEAKPRKSAAGRGGPTTTTTAAARRGPPVPEPLPEGEVTPSSSSYCYYYTYGEEEEEDRGDVSLTTTASTSYITTPVRTYTTARRSGGGGGGQQQAGSGGGRAAGGQSPQETLRHSTKRRADAERRRRRQDAADAGRPSTPLPPNADPDGAPLHGDDWASPAEVEQMRQLWQSLSHHYQAQLDAARQEADRLQRERQLYVEEVQTVKGLRKVYEAALEKLQREENGDGRPPRTGDPPTSRDSGRPPRPEDHELLVLEWQRLAIENQRLRYLLERQEKDKKTKAAAAAAAAVAVAVNSANSRPPPPPSSFPGHRTTRQRLGSGRAGAGAGEVPSSVYDAFHAPATQHCQLPSGDGAGGSPTRAGRLGQQPWSDHLFTGPPGLHSHSPQHLHNNNNNNNSFSGVSSGHGRQRSAPSRTSPQPQRRSPGRATSAPPSPYAVDGSVLLLQSPPSASTTPRQQQPGALGGAPAPLTAPAAGLTEVGLRRFAEEHTLPLLPDTPLSSSATQQQQQQQQQQGSPAAASGGGGSGRTPVAAATRTSSGVSSAGGSPPPQRDCNTAPPLPGDSASRLDLGGTISGGPDLREDGGDSRPAAAGGASGLPAPSVSSSVVLPSTAAELDAALAAAEAQDRFDMTGMLRLLQQSSQRLPSLLGDTTSLGGWTPLGSLADFRIGAGGVPRGGEAQERSATPLWGRTPTTATMASLPPSSTSPSTRPRPSSNSYSYSPPAATRASTAAAGAATASTTSPFTISPSMPRPSRGGDDSAATPSRAGDHLFPPPYTHSSNTTSNSAWSPGGQPPTSSGTSSGTGPTEATTTTTTSSSTANTGSAPPPAGGGGVPFLYHLPSSPEAALREQVQLLQAVERLTKEKTRLQTALTNVTLLAEREQVKFEQQQLVLHQRQRHLESRWSRSQLDQDRLREEVQRLQAELRDKCDALEAERTRLRSREAQALAAQREVQAAQADGQAAVRAAFEAQHEQDRRAFDAALQAAELARRETAARLADAEKLLTTERRQRELERMDLEAELARVRQQYRDTLEEGRTALEDRDERIAELEEAAERAKATATSALNARATSLTANEALVERVQLMEVEKKALLEVAQRSQEQLHRAAAELGEAKTALAAMAATEVRCRGLEEQMEVRKTQYEEEVAVLRGALRQEQRACQLEIAGHKKKQEVLYNEYQRAKLQRDALRRGGWVLVEEDGPTGAEEVVGVQPSPAAAAAREEEKTKRSSKKEEQKREKGASGHLSTKRSAAGLAAAPAAGSGEAIEMLRQSTRALSRLASSINRNSAPVGGAGP